MPQASGPGRELLFEQVVRRTLDEQEGGEIPPALMSAFARCRMPAAGPVASLGLGRGGARRTGAQYLVSR